MTLQIFFEYTAYAVLAWTFWHLFKVFLGLAKKADRLRNVQNKIGENNLRKVVDEQ